MFSEVTSDKHVYRCSIADCSAILAMFTKSGHLVPGTELFPEKWIQECHLNLKLYNISLLCKFSVNPNQLSVKCTNMVRITTKIWKRICGCQCLNLNPWHLNMDCSAFNVDSLFPRSWLVGGGSGGPKSKKPRPPLSSWINWNAMNSRIPHVPSHEAT